MERLYLLWLGHPSAAWIAIGAALLAIEVVTGSGWLLWPAAATLVPAALTTVVFRDDIGAQWAIFAVVAIALTWLGRRYLHRHPAPQREINDPRADVVGQIGRVTGVTAPGQFRVMVAGKEWAAETLAPESPNEGQRVEVTAIIGGTRLLVRAIS